MAGHSDPHLSLFSAEEVDYMAEDELIEIVPNMRMDALNLGDFGPFMPQIATQVPLWLSVALKKRGKCTTSCPEWMSVEKLTDVLDAESLRGSLLEFFNHCRFTKWKFRDCYLINKKLICNGSEHSASICCKALQAFYKHDSPEMMDQVNPSTIQQPQATDSIPRRVVRR